VGIANAIGAAVIRGEGFEKFAVQNVMFGATPATTFSVVNDTEIQATYPAFTANTYPVQIVAPSSPGPIVSLANLIVIGPTSYVATSLAYPAGTTVTAVKELLYDAQRQALLIAVDTAGGEVLRYPYAGGVWGSATTATISSLSDIALSTDGQQLLALSQQALTQLDPSALTPGTVTPAPSYTAGGFFKNLAVANDGNAIVTTGYPGSISTPLYLYAARSPGFFQTPTSPTLDNSTAGASGDGSIIAIEQGDPALAAVPNAYQYVAASQTFAATSPSFYQNSIAPALDRAATRIVFNGTNVYDGNYNLLGTLPGTTLAVVVSPDATRAYMFDSTASQILSFDLTATPGGGAYPQLASAAPAGSLGSGVRMAISPDGATLFLAGTGGVAIQPHP